MRRLPNSLHLSIYQRHAPRTILLTLLWQIFISSVAWTTVTMVTVVYLKHGANDAQLESDFRRVLLTLVMVT